MELECIKNGVEYVGNFAKNFPKEYRKAVDKNNKVVCCFLDAGYLDPDAEKNIPLKIVKTGGVAVQKIGANIIQIPLVIPTVLAHPVNSVKGVFDAAIANPVKCVKAAYDLTVEGGWSEVPKNIKLKDVGKATGDIVCVYAGGSFTKYADKGFLSKSFNVTKPLETLGLTKKIISKVIKSEKQH